MDTNCVQVRFPEYIKQMFRRIKSILSLQVYELPEMTSIASNPRLSDDGKFVLLRMILDEFKSRYGVNVSIYEFCRFRNVRIPNHFIDFSDVSPTIHQDIMSRMLNERIHSLEEMAKVSTKEEDRVFIQKKPSKTKMSREYWKFRSTKELREYKTAENLVVENESIEEEEDKDNDEEDEDFEIINKANNSKEEKETEKEETDITKEIINIQVLQKKYKYNKNKKKKRKVNEKFQNLIKELSDLEEEENEDDEDTIIKSKYKKVENLFEDRYWNTIVDLNINRQNWINVFYRSCKYKKIPDIRIDALIGEVTASDKYYFKNGKYYIGKIRNVICSEGCTIDLDLLCNQDFPEPDILIESKYWKLLRYKTKLENEPLKPIFKLTNGKWMKLKYQKLDMEF